MHYIHHYTSPLGEVILTSDGTALTGLWFEDENFADEMPASFYTEKDLPVFAQTDRWLDIYFSGREPHFTPALSAQGTSFRNAVWDILLTIPYGQTMSYGEIASLIASQRGIARMSAQAVGGAVGHNPISLIIPCHRVLGTDGSLVGYGGGLDRKQKLLKLEGIR